MPDTRRLLTALVMTFALGVSQGCVVPKRTDVRTVDPAERVFVTRQELFTLNHVRDGLAAQCTTRRVEARVTRIMADTLVLESITLRGGPQVGDCRIGGAATVVRADAPGIRIQARTVSLVRTVLWAGVLATAFLVSVLILGCVGSDDYPCP